MKVDRTLDLSVHPPRLPVSRDGQVGTPIGNDIGEGHKRVREGMLNPHGLRVGFESFEPPMSALVFPTPNFQKRSGKLLHHGAELVAFPLFHQHKQGSFRLRFPERVVDQSLDMVLQYRGPLAIAEHAHRFLDGRIPRKSFAGCATLPGRCPTGRPRKAGELGELKPVPRAASNRSGG